MCGISAIVDPVTRGDSNKDTVLNMNNIILHRGPDAGGIHVHENVILGHRRLSILDLRDLGNQPFEYEDLVITFNGEIFNYLELRDELIQKGYQFRSKTDTEIILASYKEWGVAAFDRFNGMWAFAILDKGKNELIFCRDRFGVKPLNYTVLGKKLVVASEIKQFTALPEFTPNLNYKVAANFLAYGILNHDEFTFFEGVTELRGGHYLLYNLDSFTYQIHQWYDLRKKYQPYTLSYQEAIKEFRKLFTSSVELRMRSDVAFGSCLSGGIDSSSIVTVVKGSKSCNNSFKTITSCYEDVRFDEQIFSNVVSKATGFEAIKVFPEIDELLRNNHLNKMIYHQDQPVGGASHYNEFVVFGAANENNLKVMLDGQGSDEYLCGYPEFQFTYAVELFVKRKFLQLYKFLNQKGKKWIFHQLKSHLHHIAEPIKEPFKQWLDRGALNWMNKEVLGFASNHYALKSYTSVKELSVDEVLFSSIPYQLHSEDRNSMAFSIESRVPFMDYRLVEFGLNIPAHYKLRGGFSKAIIRDAIKELPDSVKYRKDKMGFVAPDDLFIKNNAAEVRKELQDAIVITKGLINKNILKRFDLFVEGKLEYEQIYFRIISFARWAQIFKVVFNNDYHH